LDTCVHGRQKKPRKHALLDNDNNNNNNNSNNKNMTFKWLTPYNKLREVKKKKNTAINWPKLLMFNRRDEAIINRF
jgi:hypothetical protein